MGGVETRSNGVCEKKDSFFAEEGRKRMQVCSTKRGEGSDKIVNKGVAPPNFGHSTYRQ